MSRAKLTPAVAVHRHERALHKGQPLTPMKDGGKVMKKPVTGMNPMKHPKTPAAGTLAMKKGGRACMNMGGMAPTPRGPMPTPNAQAMAHANPNARFMRPAMAAGGSATADTKKYQGKMMPMDKDTSSQNHRVKMAAGGVAKIRHKQATKSGAPMAAPKRFKEPLI